MGQIAIAITLPAFNDLGRSVTPILLMDHFLDWFSTFSEKMRNIYRLEVFQNAPWNSTPVSSSYICATVSNASWRVRFCENVSNIWNHLRNRPTSTKYDWDRLLPFTHLRYLLTINPCRSCWITCAIFFKIRLVSHTLCFWNKVDDSQHFCISDTSKSISDCSTN